MRVTAAAGPGCVESPRARNRAMGRAYRAVGGASRCGETCAGSPHAVDIRGYARDWSAT